MKLILAIVNDEDASTVMSAVADAGFYATKLATTGGFLKSGNVTFLIGTDDDKVEEVCAIIREKCKTRSKVSVVAGTHGQYNNFPINVEVGGATIFVLNVEKFEKV